MMFRHRFLDAIVRGDITTTFRCWQRPQVVAGRSYKLANLGYIDIDDVSEANLSALDDDDLRATGLESLNELRQLLGTRNGTLYRIDFHYAGERPELATDTSPALSDGDWQALHDKLLAKDRRSGHDWTGATLIAIAASPGVPSVKLSEMLGRDQLALKKDVRKLKALGLTISLESGYRLSPRGERYVQRFLN